MNHSKLYMGTNYLYNYFNALLELLTKLIYFLSLILIIKKVCKFLINKYIAYLYLIFLNGFNLKDLCIFNY